MASLDDAFAKFHREHPEVYKLFRDYAYKARSSGHKKYGAKSIFERIRWHEQIERGNRDFKLNNNYTSRYARLLEEREPLFFRGFFEKRELKP